MSLIYTFTDTPITSTVTGGGRGGRRNSIYIGGRADAKSLEKLQRWGISRILNVTPTKEASIQAGVPNFFEKTQQFVYKRIPVYDSPTSVSQLERQAEEIVTFISNGLFHGSVLVHCHRGVSRSTTCVLLYLMRKAEMSLSDALRLVQRRRPEAQPIPAFLQFLERYDRERNKQKCELSSSTTRPTKKAKIGPSIIGPRSHPFLPNSTDGSLKPLGPSVMPVHGPMSSPNSMTMGPNLPTVSNNSNMIDHPSTGTVDQVKQDHDHNQDERSIGPSSIGPPTVSNNSNVMDHPSKVDQVKQDHDHDQDERSIGPSSIGPPTVVGDNHETYHEHDLNDKETVTTIGPSLPPSK